MPIELKTAEEIESLRRANGVVVAVLNELVRAVRPGITTKHLDRLAERTIRRLGATPAFLGYHGFPASICASVDCEIVHGIPREDPLREGQILSIDVGAVLDGFVGDAAVTVPVGRVDDAARRLLRTTRACLDRAVAACRPGNRLSDVGAAVEAHAVAQGYGVVREYCGHGVGRKMHEDPNVPNLGPPGRGPVLKPGLVIALEPMINEGTGDCEVLQDGWTVVTADRKRSAHFEHSVAVGVDGPIVLSEGIVLNW